MIPTYFLLELGSRWEWRKRGVEHQDNADIPFFPSNLLPFPIMC